MTAAIIISVRSTERQRPRRGSSRSMCSEASSCFRSRIGISERSTGKVSASIASHSCSNFERPPSDAGAPARISVHILFTSHRIKLFHAARQCGLSAKANDKCHVEVETGKFLRKELLVAVIGRAHGGIDAAANQFAGCVTHHELPDIGPEFVDDVALGNAGQASQRVLHGTAHGLVAVRNVSVRNRSFHELAGDDRGVNDTASVVAAPDEDAAGGVSEPVSNAVLVRAEVTRILVHQGRENKAADEGCSFSACCRYTQALSIAAEAWRKPWIRACSLRYQRI